jgi:hypothetical protein
MIIFEGNRNNNVIMNRISDERMQEMEGLLFKLQNAGDPEPPILRCYPAEFYKQFTFEELLNFSWKHAIFQFPTDELINFLKSEVDIPKTIEICAGGGHISEHLPGVIATDSKLHEEPAIIERYRSFGQCPIKYPSKIVKLEADKAVEIYRPLFVIGCWTVEQEHSGHGKGVNEMLVYRKVQKYIIVGNDHLHRSKPVLQMARALGHLTKLTPPWLVSKASYPEQNCIYIIDKLR